MNFRCILFVALVLVVPSAWSLEGACKNSAETHQYASVWWDEYPDYFDSWRVEPNVIHALSLPDGFQLGVRINQWDKQRYLRYFEEHDEAIAPERVEFTWFDLSGQPPRQLGQANGAVNSLQGFGPVSGVMGSDGPVGLALFLTRTPCVDRASLMGDQD